MKSSEPPKNVKNQSRCVSFCQHFEIYLMRQSFYVGTDFLSDRIKFKDKIALTAAHISATVW